MRGYPELGIPVLGINAVTFWYALRENGFIKPLAGGGRLLREFKVWSYRKVYYIKKCSPDEMLFISSGVKISIFQQNNRNMHPQENIETINMIVDVQGKLTK